MSVLFVKIYIYQHRDRASLTNVEYHFTSAFSTRLAYRCTRAVNVRRGWEVVTVYQLTSLSDMCPKYGLYTSVAQQSAVKCVKQSRLVLDGAKPDSLMFCKPLLQQH